MCIVGVKVRCNACNHIGLIGAKTCEEDLQGTILQNTRVWLPFKARW